MARSGVVKFKSPDTSKQAELRKKFTGMLSAGLGQTFDLPDYVPDQNELQNQAFAEAQRLGEQGFSGGVQAATENQLSGQPAYQIDPAMREAYFQAQLAPAQRDFEQNTLRQIAEQYAGGSAGRSGDFQAMLAQAAEGYGVSQQAALAELVNQDEQRLWQGYENAAQRQQFGIEAGQYNEMMPLNTMMNAGTQQYGLDIDRQQMLAQQQIMAENPLANPLMQQWLPFGLTSNKVPVSSGAPGSAWQGALGLFGGLGLLEGGETKKP